VPLAGRRHVYGFNGLVKRSARLESARPNPFQHRTCSAPAPFPHRPIALSDGSAGLTRNHMGPTTGDRLRLADTELIPWRWRRFPPTVGEEVKFGRRQGDPRRGHGPGTDHPRPGRPRHVITNALILDLWGWSGRHSGLRDGPHLRDRQGRASRTSPMASRSSSGPAPSRSLARVTSCHRRSPHTHIHFICPASKNRNPPWLPGFHHPAGRRHRPPPAATPPPATPGAFHMGRHAAGGKVWGR